MRNESRESAAILSGLKLLLCASSSGSNPEPPQTVFPVVHSEASSQATCAGCRRLPSKHDDRGSLSPVVAILDQLTTELHALQSKILCQVHSQDLLVNVIAVNVILVNVIVTVQSHF